MTRSVSEIAQEVIVDWRNMSPAAKPYASAMRSLDTVDDSYGMDSGKSIVRYFLANAGSWRGPVARRVKAELKGLLGER